jgi:hypothetical protein
VSPRVYPWIVILCGIASGLLLSQAYAFDVTILRKCGGVPPTWLLVNWLPGTMCVALWSFCTGYSMRRGGIIVSLGTVVCSAYATIRASDTFRGSGDMGCVLLFPDGAFIAIAIIVGSLLAWLGARANEAVAVVPALPPNTSLERTRDK